MDSALEKDRHALEETMEHVNSTQLVDVVGITIDQAALQAHEMRPPNLDGVTSSRDLKREIRTRASRPDSSSAHTWT